MLSFIAGLALSAQIYTHQPAAPEPLNYRMPISSRHVLDGGRIEKPELPKTSAMSEAADSNITLLAGDNRVTDNLLKSAVKIINQTSLPILSKYAGATPAKAVKIVLFSSPKTYGNALIQAGIPASDISVFTTNTGGITMDSNIWIPLYNLSDISQLANVMTHELTHVTFNQAGSGDKLPTWVNEGAAWRDGLLAEQQLDSYATSIEMYTQQRGIQLAADKGQLLPLTATEQDILTSNYNVEYEDFMAVESLIKQYGADKFVAFLNSPATNQEDVQKNFQTTYTISMDDFQTAFLQALKTTTK